MTSYLPFHADQSRHGPLQLVIMQVFKCCPCNEHLCKIHWFFQLMDYTFLRFPWTFDALMQISCITYNTKPNGNHYLGSILACEKYIYRYQLFSNQYKYTTHWPSLCTLASKVAQPTIVKAFPHGADLYTEFSSFLNTQCIVRFVYTCNIIYINNYNYNYNTCMIMRLFLQKRT